MAYNHPPNQLPWPVPEVTWAPGFSTVQPFGPGGYSFLNGATGLTEYQPPLQGNYVIAVEIKEYRNGQLIGRTRRDLQLQAIPCPPNNTPQVSGNLPTSYTVNAGDQLCFNMDFIDVDLDSITLNASGTIFNGTLFNPARHHRQFGYGQWLHHLPILLEHGVRPRPGPAVPFQCQRDRQRLSAEVGGRGVPGERDPLHRTADHHGTGAGMHTAVG